MNSKFAESTNKASEGLNLDIGIIRFKRLSSSAFAPTKGSEDSAGVDLISPHDWVIPAGRQAKIPLEISFEFPQGCYGRLTTSGTLAMKNLMVNAGVLDRDYTGNVYCCLVNLSNEEYRVKRGEIIVQLICERYVNVSCMEMFARSGRGDDCGINRAVAANAVPEGPATIPGTPRAGPQSQGF